MFDFDTSIDRRPWSSYKWDKYLDRDILAFWVADMDFATPQFLIDAINARMEHPILGYTDIPANLRSVVAQFIARRFNWEIDPDWIVPIESVVPGLGLAVRSIGLDGDNCLIPVPVYPPFFDVAELNRHRVAHSQLVRCENRWVMDFDDIAHKARHAKSLLFCNPHNPTGRVYTKAELLQLSEICLETETTIISDEIHWGLVLDPGSTHVPIGSLSSETGLNTITLISHTKTYNIAGMQSAVAIIPDPQLRSRYQQWVLRTMPAGSPLSYAAAIAAYEDTSSWIDELTSYLRGNRDLLQEAIDSLPRLEMLPIEGTHLGWIDARSLPVEDTAAYFEAHGLGFSDGAEFGAPGYVRWNFAAPRDLVRRGLNRLERAIECAP